MLGSVDKDKVLYNTWLYSLQMKILAKITDTDLFPTTIYNWDFSFHMTASVGIDTKVISEYSQQNKIEKDIFISKEQREIGENKN